MKKVQLPIDKLFTTAGEVQNECNFIETVLPGLLLSLAAGGKKEEHITTGTYNRMTSDEFLEHSEELGNLKFKLDNGGTNTVWINGEKIKVSFSRNGD